jgi:hypothetical protein
MLESRVDPQMVPIVRGATPILRSSLVARASDRRYAASHQLPLLINDRQRGEVAVPCERVYVSASHIQVPARLSFSSGKQKCFAFANSSTGDAVLRVPVTRATKDSTGRAPQRLFPRRRQPPNMLDKSGLSDEARSENEVRLDWWFRHSDLVACSSSQIRADRLAA